MNEEEQHILQKWFSIGDLLSLVVMLVALGTTYGSISKDIESLKLTVAELRQIRITPGAETALATIQAKDAAQDMQLSELRQELREQRREILDALNKLDAELQSHR